MFVRDNLFGAKNVPTVLPVKNLLEFGQVRASEENLRAGCMCSLDASWRSLRS